VEFGACGENGPSHEPAVKMVLSPTTMGPVVKIFTAGPLGTGGENDSGKNSFYSSVYIMWPWVSIENRI